MGSRLGQLLDKSRVFNQRKMGATRFFIFSTFLVLMFGFALSLPTVGDPEQVSGEGPSRMIRALGPAGTPEGRFERSPDYYEDTCRRVRQCYKDSNGKRQCYWTTTGC